jgi:hypothetical protein
MPVPPRIPDFDVFETLGVARDDPPEVIKAAWRQRVKEHHPDASGGSDDQIKRINVAYDWLRDPTLRQTYLLATGGRRSLQADWHPEPGVDLDPREGPPFTLRYQGPRTERIDALGNRIGAAGMGELLDLVHGYRPDLRWSFALARGIEVSRRQELGATAVWQIRRAVRDRVDALLVTDALRATYDEELVGHVVSDRLADLVRGIVLLDVLTPAARARLTAEWNQVMGPRAGPPGDEPGIGVRPGGLSNLGASWRRAPDGFRWLTGVLAAALYATAVSALFPSGDAIIVILLGFGIVAAVLLGRR